MPCPDAAVFGPFPVDVRRCFCFLSKQLGIRSCRDKRRLA